MSSPEPALLSDPVFFVQTDGSLWEQARGAPQLLSPEQPDYPWEASGGLVVRYDYGFLPKGIVTRFIVAMHRLIADPKLVWRTGVILERDRTQDPSPVPPEDFRHRPPAEAAVGVVDQDGSFHRFKGSGPGYDGRTRRTAPA